MTLFSYWRIATVMGLISISFSACKPQKASKPAGTDSPQQQMSSINYRPIFGDSIILKSGTTVKVINGTFLGAWSRNFYGDSIPAYLDVLWKARLGTGTTWINATQEEKWSGAGWTGQPLFIYENEQPFLIQGSFDHTLKKINALSGEIVWSYPFEDVLKATGTVRLNRNAGDPENQILILQGSRYGGKNLRRKVVNSYRAVSYLNGQERWRMNVGSTRSYSRDVDASALILNDTAYIGLENGVFTVFDPDYKRLTWRDSFWEPHIYSQFDTLFTKNDSHKHGGNLVTEASPVLLGDHIYVCSGSGHIYGYNLKTRTLDWQFFVGSDLDGTPVVTEDACLLVAVEKQYINGQGGVMKLNPRKAPEQALEWYFPTPDKKFASWEGGVIGSVALQQMPLNNRYEQPKTHGNLCAFSGIDGDLYVVQHTSLSTEMSRGFDGEHPCYKPKLIAQYKTGGGISTPLFIGNRILAAGYGGLYVLELDEKKGELRKLAYASGRFEATPFVWQGKVYLAGRSGYLCAYGKDETLLKRPSESDVKPVKKPLASKSNPNKSKPIASAKPAKVKDPAKKHVLDKSIKKEPKEAPIAKKKT